MMAHVWRSFRWAFLLFKNTLFLGVLCASLFISTATLAFKAITLGAQVASLSAGAASAAIAQKKAVGAAVTRTKAKARLRRLVVMVPLAGIAAGTYFEYQDFQEWQSDNPDRDRNDYACEVSQASAEVVDEVLQDLPLQVRPDRALVLSQLPECTPPAQ